MKDPRMVLCPVPWPRHSNWFEELTAINRVILRWINRHFPNEDDEVKAVQDVERDVYMRPEIANPRDLPSKLHHDPPYAVT